MLDFTIDDKVYQLIDNVNVDNKDYIAYTDGEIVGISEYKIINNNLEIIPISDEIFNKIKEIMEL